MIRKSIFALAAIATLGAAALAPTSASAWGFKGWHHPHFGLGIGFIDTAPVADCYLVTTRSGRLVQVCD